MWRIVLIILQQSSTHFKFIFQNKLTGVFRGIDLLHAIGFQLKVEEDSDAPGGEDLGSSTGKKQAVSDNSFGLETAPLASRISYDEFISLCHGTEHTVRLMFTMGEPSLVDTSAWVAWFDGLTAIRDELRNALANT